MSKPVLNNYYVTYRTMEDGETVTVFQYVDAKDEASAKKKVASEMRKSLSKKLKTLEAESIESIKARQNKSAEDLLETVKSGAW